jgi:uncharacterized membrane protein
MKQLECTRMNLQEYEVLFIVVISILALLVASPVLQRLLVYPQTEVFTEMWLLGPEHKAENYPFNITIGENYHVFLGIANHLEQCTYYLIQLKFRNQTQSAADSFNRTPSTLLPLYSITVFVADKEKLEIPISFSFNYVQNSYNETLLQVRFLGMTFNDAVLNLNGYTAVWDAERSGFFGNLFFELWIYNSTVGALQYHERFTGLWLNMTS